MEVAAENIKAERQQILESMCPRDTPFILVHEKIHPGVRIAIGARETHIIETIPGPVRVGLRKIKGATEIVAVDQETGSVILLPGMEIDLDTPIGNRIRLRRRRTMENRPKVKTATNEDLAMLVSEVLGNLAFMVSDDEPAELPPGAVWLQCEVGYQGPVGGTLRCWCTRDFAIQLAANLLGIEPMRGMRKLVRRMPAREFMNVLCGHLVTAWYGSEAIFNLSIPIVKECLETPQPPGNESITCCQISISGESFYCAHTQ